jgi:Flp pilus assembly protein TadG
MIARSRGKGRQSARGATLIEFAVVALLFFMLLFVFIEFARMFLVYNAVASSARVGVRYAIVNGSGDGSRTAATVDQIRIVVQNFAGAAPLVKDEVAVIVNRPCTNPGCQVEVIAAYPYRPFLRYFFPDPVINMGSTSSGRIAF